MPKADAKFSRKAEIYDVSIPQSKGDPAIAPADEHPRETNLDKLSVSGKPFRQVGTLTAGNASGVNDGAAALLIASEAAVKAHGLAKALLCHSLHHKFRTSS